MGADTLRSLRYRPQRGVVEVIDQTLLPGCLVWRELREPEDFCHAIVSMQVRGAPLIGITAAYGLALALQQDASAEHQQRTVQQLLATRPTAINLRWALAEVEAACVGKKGALKADAALARAAALVEEDVAVCREIGAQGLALLQELCAADGSRPLQILTHCNAGWLATIEWGTALAPVYAAQRAGLPVHVWVSETRPRNQGLSLTAWELDRAGIAHTVIADNAAGHLMQKGLVDGCFVGSDRTVANGDVCNKVGTYLKALAARASDVPFYVALPTSTIDWQCASGVDIPIEERAAAEILHIAGRDQSGAPASVQLGVASTRAFDPAFDVTPAALVTRLVTEKGVVEPDEVALAQLRARCVVREIAGD